MRFVDEAGIEVRGGRGGDGCLSFRRERNVARGGPDGGDGGRGGDVWLEASPALNTLVDFRFERRYAAGDGRPGEGGQRTGAGGSDAFVAVPTGTTVVDADTREVLGDLVEPGERLLVAQGGRNGLGNERFKSSTNRSPRRTTPGEPGEARRLLLQLRLIADAGLLGMPNAGKSTLLRALSAARPKVADYPFTTLTPHLGVVRVGAGRSFVLADIPGLIEGAADGAGLGIRFLKHVSRTRVLLHVVDLVPVDGSDPADAVARVTTELERFSPALAQRERWLVVNKIDALPESRRRRAVASLVDRLSWSGPFFAVSAASGEGTATLAQAVLASLEERRGLEREARAEAEAEAEQREAIAADVLRQTLLEPAAGTAGERERMPDADDDDDVEVEYVR